MSHHARAAKTSASSSISPSKSKKKSVPIRKITRNSVQKKISPKKQTSSSTITQPRQKRLASLTAATLLQYCTSILSPSRKLKSSPKQVTNKSPIDDKTNQSTTSRKRQISNVSENKTELHIPTRIHREASSRASAMIMQQNEIERSRYNYSLVNKRSTSTIRRHRTKSKVTNKDDIPPEPFKFNIPSVPLLPAPAPSITNVSNQTEYTPSSNAVTTKSTHPLPSTTITTNSKYPSLTEAILAEHDRLHETIPSYQTKKNDKLLKWTQELALCDRLSPPYSEHEIPSESSTTKNLATHSTTKEITPSSIADSKTLDSLPVNISSRSLEHLSTINNVTTPNFLFPSSAYPLDLRSFYPLLPCWQYPNWPVQSSSVKSKTSVKRHRTLTHPETKTKKLTTFNSINPIHKQKKEALTFHLHTHHHHHIHDSNSSSLLKSLNPTKTTTIPLSSEKSSISINKNQFIETKTILPLSINNIVKNEHQQISPTIENQILNLSTNNQINLNGTIKKTTRRKSSPVKRRIDSGTKSNSSLIPFIGDKIPQTSHSFIAHNQVPVSNLNDNPSTRRVPKRRSVSAATTNCPTIFSITGRNSRGKRTNSASNRKRSYSPASITLPLSNNNQRKKQKILHYWILFGKSEQKLVSIHADKPPVFRECYSSIRHITEKDVIKSNDCVILRSETGTHHSTTPYLAKVKWFWEEPTTGTIQMSLLWYYHPEHTELSMDIKQRFLPNELLASKYSDCVSVECIEDKCYVLNLNEYNRYCLREKSTNLFEHSESVGQLKFLLNKNTPTIHHRLLPAKTVGNQNIFFCRYVYDYRVKRILKNPTFVTTASSM